ncbi:MAG TPA: antibiotic biosynthesis monooxygenase [Steroidobacteraceae bacterium]|nr:antibiotic biosynthesis monooxygenase [Steroidobacteraceae bacterium]
MDINIRQATVADINELMDIVLACTLKMQSRGIDQWDDIYPDFGTIQCDIGGGAVFIASISGVMAGMATLGEHQFLEVRGESMGCDCVRLDVFMQNPRAARFYEISSYRRAGQVRFRKGEFHCYEKIIGSHVGLVADSMETAVILEVAILNVRAGSSADFESSFMRAEPVIAGSSGYISHELRRCMEVENRYILLVRWRCLEDHTIGFRGSEAYQEWKALLHHYYDPFPDVEHYECL